MPTETRYVDAGKGAHKYCRGMVTSAEILAMGRQQAADVEATRKIKYFLYDMTEVTDLQICADTIAKLVELNRITAENSPGAVGAVVAPNPLAFGMARMWQSFACDIGWKVQIFRDRAAAIQWLREQLGEGDPDSSALDEFPSLKMVAAL